MANHLIIVESPAKVKTISKFLGKSYTIDATMGHLIDMPKSSLGVDVENDYEPKYITIRGKGELLSKLKKEAKKADKIYLATDPDREGEAISWHLQRELNKDEKNAAKISRISFNEITKNAVQNALKNPKKSIWIWSMLSRQEESWIAWWGIPSVLCFGRRFVKAYPREECSP